MTCHSAGVRRCALDISLIHTIPDGIIFLDNAICLCLSGIKKSNKSVAPRIQTPPGVIGIRKNIPTMMGTPEA